MNQKRRISLVAAVVAALALACGGTAHAAPPKPIPVNYNFLQNAIMYGALPTAPGQNDWECVLSPAHPRPVVLVHGTAGSAAGNWGTLSAVLANEGFCVFALTYGLAPALASLPVPVGGMKTLEDSAVELATFIDRVRAATGADKVDIVGHSQGTIMPNHYAKYLGGGAYIDRYVSISPLWKGTGVSPLPGQLVALSLAYGINPSTILPVAKFGPQVLIGSPYITAMREGGVAVPGITYINIVTKYDQLILPYTNGLEAGMTNIVLQDHCALDLSDHVQIPSSPTAVQLVLNALDPAHAKKPPCRLVLPLVGLSG